MTASRIHLFLASLMGASGVALWAMAAHRAGGASMVTAAQFLLLHAAAVIGLTACRKQSLINTWTASLGVSGLILGTVLFSGDLAMRTLAGGGMFLMAAPIGGSLLIAAWVVVAVSALVRTKDPTSG
jgi:uncharacterized membrane protein YgdD (TMEM256/DUF423 family)